MSIERRMLVLRLRCRQMIDIIADSAAYYHAKQQERRRDLLHEPASFDEPPPLPEDSESTEARKQHESERVRRRLGEMGFRIGWSLVERLSRDKTPFNKVMQTPAQPTQSAPQNANQAQSGQTQQPSSQPAPPMPMMPISFEPLDLVKFL